MTPIDEFFSYRPVKVNVSSVESMRELAVDYPNEEVGNFIKQVSKKYPSYRKINGDGNCFYRAMAFLYLSHIDLSSSPFKKVEMICHKFPIDFEGVKFGEMLQVLWQKYLLPVREYDQPRRQEHIIECFNRSWGFDALLIAYFRIINHNYISTNRKRFIPYTEKPIQSELEKVKTFNQESEGIEIPALTELLNVKVTVVMAFAQSSREEVHMVDGNYHFKLFFRPGHYDILVDSSNKLQRNTFNSKLTNLSKVNQQYPNERQWNHNRTNDNRVSDNRTNDNRVNDNRVTPQVKDNKFNQRADYSSRIYNPNQQKKQSQESALIKDRATLLQQNKNAKEIDRNQPVYRNSTNEKQISSKIISKPQPQPKTYNPLQAVTTQRKIFETVGLVAFLVGFSYLFYSFGQ